MEFNNVIAFSEQSKDLYDAMKAFARETLNENKGLKAFESTSKEEQMKLINKAFSAELSRLSGMEVPSAKDKTAVARFAMKTNVQEFAEETRDVLIDAILPDILNDSILKYIADIKYADFGDTIKFTIKSNQLLTVSKAGNRKRRTNVQKTYVSDVTMSGENHMVTVGTNLYEILIGQSFLAEEVMKAALAIETDMLYSAYDAFANAADALTGALSVTNYSEETLIKLYERVRAWNGGAKPIVIGTPLALSHILPSDTNYRYNFESEYVRVGYLQNFKNMDIVAMEQVADPYNTSQEYALKFDDTKLYVVSPATDKIVKMGVFGGVMAHQNDGMDNANTSVLHTISANYEAQVITNSICGVVKSIQ